MPTVTNTYPGRPDNGDAMDGDVVASRFDALYAVVNVLDDDNFVPAAGKELNLATKARLENATYLTAKIAAGTAVNILGLTAGNALQLGNASYATQVLGASLTVTPNATFSGTLGVTGAATFSSNVDVAGDARHSNGKGVYVRDTASNYQLVAALNASDQVLFGASSLVAYIRGTTINMTPSTALNVDSGTLYVDATNNRVGVGTASPGQTLHVSGASQLSGNTAIGANASPTSTSILNIEQAYTGSGSMYGVRVIPTKTTTNADMLGVYMQPTVSGITVTNWWALYLAAPSLSTATLTNRYFAYLDSGYTQTTIGSSGTASALPAQPSGYVKIQVGASTYAIPYYNA
jgi:hypothetical protein